jgi:hypothetical protein
MEILRLALLLIPPIGSYYVTSPGMERFVWMVFVFGYWSLIQRVMGKRSVFWAIGLTIFCVAVCANLKLLGRGSRDQNCIETGRYGTETRCF